MKCNCFQNGILHLRDYIDQGYQAGKWNDPPSGETFYLPEMAIIF